MCRVLGWSHQSSCSSASKATPMVDPAELHVTAETLRPRIYLEMVYVIWKFIKMGNSMVMKITQLIHLIYECGENDLSPKNKVKSLWLSNDNIYTLSKK